MDNLYTLFDLFILHKMTTLQIILSIAFLLFVVQCFRWANQEDKRRFKNKAKEIGLDDFENEIRGDVRRHNNIKQNIK